MKDVFQALLCIEMNREQKRINTLNRKKIEKRIRYGGYKKPRMVRFIGYL